MIYAKIVNQKKNQEGHDILFVHFYGTRAEIDGYSKEIKDSNIHPYSFLAINDFVPVSDVLFIKK